MTSGTGSPTALIVDDDVAFILWLGEMFNESGYRAFPALHCQEALTLAKKFALRVDVLVVNPALPGAKRAMRVLAGAQPSLRVLLIRDGSKSGPVEESTHPTLERPSAWEPISRPQWVIKIRRLLMRASAAK